MFKDNKYLKADARESLLGNLSLTVLAVFLHTMSIVLLSEAINGINSNSRLLSLVLSVFIFIVVNTCANMLRIGLCCIFLKLQFRQTAKLGDMLYAFRNNSDTAVLISVFVAVLEFMCILPYLLFSALTSGQAFPGGRFIALFLLGAGLLANFAVRIRYAVCSYLFLDFPGFSGKELLRGGMKLMRGNFSRLIKLYLSFLPLFFLSFLSFGIAGLWVNCYTHAAEAAFYKDLMAKTSF